MPYRFEYSYGEHGAFLWGDYFKLSVFHTHNLSKFHVRMSGFQHDQSDRASIPIEII